MLAESADQTGDESDLAKGTAHGGQAFADLIPVVAGERPERLADVTKGLGCDDHADGSGNVVLAESADQTGDCAHLRQGTAHGRQTTSDLVPIVLREGTKSLADVTKGLGCDDHADGSGNVVLAESAEQTGDCAHLRHGTAHGGQAFADLIPAHVTELLERIRHHFDRLGHSDERACRLEVDLGVAQALGGGHKLAHGTAHAGEAFGDLAPV